MQPTLVSKLIFHFFQISLFLKKKISHQPKILYILQLVDEFDAKKRKKKIMIRNRIIEEDTKYIFAWVQTFRSNN